VNLLITIIKLKADNKKMSFALTVSIIRQHLMSYINILAYLKYPEGLRKEFKRNYNFRKKYNNQTELVSTHHKFIGGLNFINKFKNLILSGYPEIFYTLFKSFQTLMSTKFIVLSTKFKVQSI
jgi:hypothetical protein